MSPPVPTAPPVLAGDNASLRAELERLREENDRLKLAAYEAFHAVNRETSRTILAGALGLVCPPVPVAPARSFSSDREPA